MCLEAIFSREDVRAIAERFSPLKLLLGDGGSVVLLGPSESYAGSRSSSPGPSREVESFALPACLASAAALTVRAIAGKVKVTEVALALAVDFEASVKTRQAMVPSR